MLIAFFTSFTNQGTIILVPDTLGLEEDLNTFSEPDSEWGAL